MQLFLLSACNGGHYDDYYEEFLGVFSSAERRDAAKAYLLPLLQEDINLKTFMSRGPSFDPAQFIEWECQLDQIKKTNLSKAIIPEHEQLPF